MAISKTEIIWKKVFELDTESPNYWSNLFNLSNVLFDPTNTDNAEQKEINTKNKERLRADLLNIMSYFKQGDRTPNFYLIQMTFANMQEGDFIKVKNNSNVTKIYKSQLRNELEKIKTWLYAEIGRMPVRFSSSNMTVTNM